MERYCIYHIRENDKGQRFLECDNCIREVTLDIGGAYAANILQALEKSGLDKIVNDPKRFIPKKLYVPSVANNYYYCQANKTKELKV